VYPEHLNSTLQSRKLRNVYMAGQINGSSGYEEAAVQGMIAGLNAGFNIRNK
jgi:tRNA uridine 5-carboxymethylaminomethyl modification enzyme